MMMGGMGMGGMGMGGMGGMGMGMGMGGRGMGGGFRSVPPTSLPYAALKPAQTRHLPTQVVSLNTPNGEKPDLPAKGEALRLSDIGQQGKGERVASALKRLAAEKAPASVAQLVMWNVSGGLDWSAIEEISRGWANPQELALARRFVERLGTGQVQAVEDPGTVRFEVTAAEGFEAQADALRAQFRDRSLLGLKAVEGVPAMPDGPGVAVRVKLDAKGAAVSLGVSAPDTADWQGAGSFVTRPDRDGAKAAELLADRIAQGMLDKLVRVHVTRGGVVKGKDVYLIKVENGSPLVLNGLAVAGSVRGSEETPKVVNGLCLPPRRTLNLATTLEVVERLGLRKGARVTAADLSGL
jgi:hypothetical protein